MKSLFFLLVSGVFWLILVQLAPHFGVPSQIISLARSGYIAIFSIYMMVELRGAKYSSQHRPSHIYLYLLPLLSLALLSLYSSDLSLNASLLSMLGCFYISAFAIINFRSERGYIRNAGWDLLAPPILFFLIVNPLLTIIGGLISIIYLARLLSRPLNPDAGQSHLDSFVVQLPSICIAPVVLIALRDVFDGGGLIDRSHIESFGLVVNGVGAAIWTAMVMRNTFPLDRAALALWILGFLGTMINFVLPVGILSSAGAILIAESFRGAVWLGTTIGLANLTRGKGFSANLIATVLPLSALWLSKGHFSASMTLFIYAAFVFPIPFAAWTLMRVRRKSTALLDNSACQFDDASTSISVFEQKS